MPDGGQRDGERQRVLLPDSKAARAQVGKAEPAWNAVIVLNCAQSTAAGTFSS